MAYVVDFDVDGYGYVTGGEEFFPTPTTFHDWTTPYPAIAEELNLAWTPGDRRIMPDIMCHNQLRDLVCRGGASDVLAGFDSSDLHVVAHGRIAGDAVTIVQAVAVLDVVDIEQSIPSQFSWGGLDWPHIRPEMEGDVARRVFRVPNRGLTLTVLLGDQVHQALQAAGIRGLRLVKAEVLP